MPIFYAFLFNHLGHRSIKNQLLKLIILFCLIPLYYSFIIKNYICINKFQFPKYYYYKVDYVSMLELITPSG